jgi:TIR domain
MPNDRRYQLVVMGPAVNRFLPDLDSEFTSQIADIGLVAGTGQDAEILVSETMKLTDVQWDSAPAAIWFGEENATGTAKDLLVLEDFQVKRPNPVFPVCETLDGYEDKVPLPLRPINGQAWEQASVVANVLKAFDLTREERQVFISYRRTDSEAVARQLYDALQQRKFRVFLDTASVDAGVLFQDVLHGRLSDVDLVVFLDTKNALDSEWVYEELLQAEKQGFGIFQVLWPERKQDPATQFCDPYFLQRQDFVSWSPPVVIDYQPDPKDVLTDTTVDKIVREVERTRIRSIRNRRDQVLTEIIDSTKSGPLKSFVNPTGKKGIPFSFIEFQKDDKPVGLAFPVVGFPDSILLNNRHDLLEKNQLVMESACVVYDELGMTPALKSHLIWLNKNLKIRTVAITGIAAWLGGLK